jgi:hypothetical protein
MQQQYQCSNCGAQVAFGVRFCGNCGVQLNWPTHQQVQSTPVYQQWQRSGELGRQGAFMQNTSGQGKSALVPFEIKEWNWGAFTFNWLWGVCNSVWMSLLCFISIVATIMVFVLGAKGNEWAWQSKRWDSIEHFRRTQRTWRNWAIAIYVLYFILILVVVIAESSTPTSISPPPTS